MLITDTRAELLRAIANPDVEVYASLGSIFNTSWADANVWVKRPDDTLRKVTKVVGDLEKAGLVERAPEHAAAPDAPWGARNAARRLPRHYTLTDAGRKALAEYDATAGANR